MLQRASTAEQVADILRGQLLRGEVAPGARLREVAIAEGLGVSRNTVREAMRLLAAEGLVRHSLHRGVVVSELTDDDLADVYRAKRALELAGIAAVGDAGPDWLDGLRAAARRMSRARDTAELAQADLAFHQHVVSAIRSRRIERQYIHIQAELRLSRAWSRRERGNPRQMYERHQEVVDALGAGEPARAARLLEAINEEGERRLRDAVRIRDRPASGVPRTWPDAGSDPWSVVVERTVVRVND